MNNTLMITKDKVNAITVDWDASNSKNKLKKLYKLMNASKVVMYPLSNHIAIWVNDKGPYKAPYIREIHSDGLKMPMFYDCIITGYRKVKTKDSLRDLAEEFQGFSELKVDNIVGLTNEQINYLQDEIYVVTPLISSQVVLKM